MYCLSKWTSSYDAIVGLDEAEGGVLSMREYVVFKPEQALPKYLLMVTATDVGVMRARTADVSTQTETDA